MELDQLIPRFSRVAQLSVVTLIVTGIVHALAVAGGFSELARLTVRSGPADQGLDLRIDAADGQPRSQICNPGGVPTAASATGCTREKRWHLGAGRGDGSRAQYRIRDLVNDRTSGNGGAPSVVRMRQLATKITRLPSQIPMRSQT